MERELTSAYGAACPPGIQIHGAKPLAPTTRSGTPWRPYSRPKTEPYPTPLPPPAQAWRGWLDRLRWDQTGMQ